MNCLFSELVFRLTVLLKPLSGVRRFLPALARLKSLGSSGMSRRFLPNVSKE